MAQSERFFLVCRQDGNSFLLIPCFILVGTLWLSACSTVSEATSPDCSSESIAIVPTATRQTDPNLYIPPQTVSDGNADPYCPTPIPATTPTSQAPERFITTEIANLSLDFENQDLAAVAVGDDMIAVGWITDGNVYVALSRGGNHFQVRRVDAGNSVSLAFSEANRLHVVYEKMGQLIYLAADQGSHPAEAYFVTSPGYGHNPQIAIDSRQWAHIIYESEGNIWHAAHLYEFYWNNELVGPGERPSLITDSRRLGNPEFGSRDFALAYLSGNEVQVRLYGITPFLVPGWLSASSFVVPEPVDGFVHLDAMEIEEQLWLYAAWVSERPSTTQPIPDYQQPIFEAANPLFPDQLANPHHIHLGLNAVRWRGESSPFAAGLWQTIPVTDTTGTITVSAWGLAETAITTSPADMTLRIGIDPTGGNNPDSPTVIWSEAVAPADFTEFTLSVPAQGSVATLFLRGTLNSLNLAGTAVWDAVTISNGNGTNLNFEGGFVTQDSLTVPEGWTAWYQDGGSTVTNGRNVTTVYATWSDDGGQSWAAPAEITANVDGTGSTTGAIQPNVTPIMTTATEPPSVSFFYIYESGDPPPNSTFLRFGRPYQIQCDLNTTTCTDTPGQPLFSSDRIRPSTHLMVVPDPFNPARAVIAWDALQTDTLNKDVYVSNLVLR